jgi:hypothetical protein
MACDSTDLRVKTSRQGASLSGDFPFVSQRKRRDFLPRRGKLGVTVHFPCSDSFYSSWNDDACYHRLASPVSLALAAAMRFRYRLSIDRRKPSAIADKNHSLTFDPPLAKCYKSTTSEWRVPSIQGSCPGVEQRNDARCLWFQVSGPIYKMGLSCSLASSSRRASNTRLTGVPEKACPGPLRS